MTETWKAAGQHGMQLTRPAGTYSFVGSTIRCRFPHFGAVVFRFPRFVSVCTVLVGHWEVPLTSEAEVRYVQDSR